MDVDSPRPETLAATWRAQAEAVRPYAPAAATAFDRCATELEAALDSASAELLTLQEAAEASGYSADHLGRLIRSGKLISYGRPHAPRLRRADLPRKAPAVAPSGPPLHLLGATPRQVAQAVASTHRGDR